MPPREDEPVVPVILTVATAGAALLPCACFMSAEELTRRVIGVIARTNRVSPETITPETTFQELGMDSLDAVNVLFALEEEFNVNIPDEDAREIRTVRQVIEGIGKLLAAGSQGGARPLGEQAT